MHTSSVSSASSINNRSSTPTPHPQGEPGGINRPALAGPNPGAAGKAHADKPGGSVPANAASGAATSPTLNASGEVIGRLVNLSA